MSTAQRTRTSSDRIKSPGPVQSGASGKRATGGYRPRYSALEERHVSVNTSVACASAGWLPRGSHPVLVGFDHVLYCMS